MTTTTLDLDLCPHARAGHVPAHNWHGTPRSWCLGSHLPWPQAQTPQNASLAHTGFLDPLPRFSVLAVIARLLSGWRR